MSDFKDKEQQCDKNVLITTPSTEMEFLLFTGSGK